MVQSGAGAPPGSREIRPRAAWLRNAWPLGCILAAGLIAVLLTWRHYGSNWDEAVQANYGELAVNYFRSGFTDTRCNQIENLRFYGPLVEMIPAVLFARVKSGAYEWRHLYLAFFGLATLPAVYGFASLFGRSRRLPAFAALALATMPRFYGDWFGNSKDVPFACAFAWAMYALASALGPAAFTRRGVLATGAAFGLALAVRPGGFPLLLLFFAAGVLLRHAGSAREAWAALLPAAGIFAEAWVIMVIPWPWAHANPIAHPIQAMREAASFSTAYPVLFEGVVRMSNAIPRTYLPKYLAITAPPGVLALAAIGLGAGLWEARRAWRERKRAPQSGPSAWLFLLTSLWFFLPIALFMVARPNVYDGIRHFLFLLPGLALLAGSGATWLVERVPGGRARAVAGVAAVIVFLAPVKDLVALHPYETTYFNGFVGGVRGADGKYDTEYWLTSYREAIQWVNAQAAGRAGAHGGASMRVIVAGDGFIVPWLRYYLAPGVEAQIVSKPPEAPTLPDGVDYYISTKRWGLAGGFARAPIVHTIGREGAVFTVIKGRG